MDRARRVRDLWNWLPAFRAVAETEHLPTAARQLHVSPSSLSRAVGLLEEQVGRPLFRRVGRRIELDDAGRELLGAVRIAMRAVDDALALLSSKQLVGKVTVHVPGPMAPLVVLPAFDALLAEHPRLVPVVASVPTPQVPAALNRGEIDAAVVEGDVASEGLAVRELMEVPHAVCAAPSHPLAGCGRVTAEDLLAYPFVAPIPRKDGTIPDRWPMGRPRRVGVFVAQMQVAIELCRQGRHVAVLPWPVAHRAGLVPLAFAGIPPATLYVVHRPDLPGSRTTRAVVEALAQRAATLQGIYGRVPLGGAVAG